MHQVYLVCIVACLQIFASVASSGYYKKIKKDVSGVIYLDTHYYANGLGPSFWMAAGPARLVLRFWDGLFLANAANTYCAKLDGTIPVT